MDSRIALWTRGAERLYGFSKAEAIGRVSHELFQKEFAQGMAYVDERLRNVDQWRRGVGAPQARRPAIVVASQQIVYRDSNGRAMRILEVNADITELKRVELDLRESQRRFEGIIDSAMDAIISVNEAQRVVLFNAGAEQMSGCAAAEAPGQPQERFFQPGSGRVHRAHVRGFATTGVTNRAMGKLGSLTALQADSREFPIEASISQTEVGGDKLFTAILRDIPSGKRLKRP